MTEEKPSYRSEVPTGADASEEGTWDHPVRRAPDDSGYNAPMVDEGGDHAQFSIYDGSGNENVVVVADDPKGRSSAGTGHDAAEALEDATSNEKIIGDLYEPEE